MPKFFLRAELLPSASAKQTFALRNLSGRVRTFSHSADSENDAGWGSAYLGVAITIAVGVLTHRQLALAIVGFVPIQ